MTTTLSLTPTEVNIEVVQGTDNPIEFQLLRTVNGVDQGIDITNDSVMFTAKDAYGGNVTIATKTNGPSGHETPTDGKTIFTLTKTDTTTSDPSSEVIWVYEVRRLDSATNREYVHIQGELHLKPMVGESA